MQHCSCKTSKSKFAIAELTLSLTRRQFLASSAPFALAFAGFAGAILPPLVPPAWADDTPSPADLANAGPDGDITVGSDKAPVTVIEYASMTCPHCAHFAETTFPELQKRYIDTGKVRFIFREFPLDQLAAAGFILARCAGPDKYFPLIETLFAQQRAWVVQKPLPPLLAIAKQAGLSQQAFEACLDNREMLDGIEKVRNEASEKFGVQSTPTFFINGKLLSGDLSIEDM